MHSALRLGSDGTLSAQLLEVDRGNVLVTTRPIIPIRAPGTAMTHADLGCQRLQQLPDSVAAEVLDAVLYLEQKQRPGGDAPERRPGSAKDQVWTACLG